MAPKLLSRKHSAFQTAVTLTFDSKNKFFLLLDRENHKVWSLWVKLNSNYLKKTFRVPGLIPYSWFTAWKKNTIFSLDKDRHIMKFEGSQWKIGNNYFVWQETLTMTSDLHPLKRVHLLDSNNHHKSLKAVKKMKLTHLGGSHIRVLEKMTLAFWPKKQEGSFD